MDESRVNGETGDQEEAGRGPAARVIERFGGIRPMAAKLGVPVTTVQYWKKRGHIPAVRRQDILDAAARHDITLDLDELDAAQREEAGAEAPAAAEPAPPESPARPEPSPAHAPAAAAPAAAQPASARATPDRAARALAALALLLGASGLGLALYDRQRGTEAPSVDTRVDELAAAVPGLSERLARLEARGTEPNPALDSLAQRLDALEGELQAASGAAGQLQALAQRIEQLEARPASTTLASSEVEELRGRIQELAQIVGQFGQRLDGVTENTALVPDLRARVDSLAADVSRLQNADDRAGAFALAVGQLTTALARSDSFTTEIAAVRELATDDAQVQEAIRALEPYAFNGIPTVSQLAVQFDLLATEMLRAELPQQEGWRETLSRALGNVVTVRRVPGSAEGDSTDAIIARAQARLEQGDLEGALTELDGLTGPAAETVQPWKEDANARLLANRAASVLAAQAAQRLAPESTEGAQP